MIASPRKIGDAIAFSRNDGWSSRVIVVNLGILVVF